MHVSPSFISQIFHLSKLKLSPLNTKSPFPIPTPISHLPNLWALALPMYFLILWMWGTILGTLYKWNQTVFVCICCILECIFKVNLISLLQTDCTFFPRPHPMLYSRFSSVIYFIHSSALFILGVWTFILSPQFSNCFLNVFVAFLVKYNLASQPFNSKHKHPGHWVSGQASSGEALATPGAMQVPWGCVSKSWHNCNHPFKPYYLGNSGIKR